MTYLTVDVQLNVDESSRPLGDSAYLWFDTVTAALIPAERAELAELPAATKLNPYSDKAQGKPGQLYGYIEVSRSTGGRPKPTHRNLSRAGLEWLRTELTDLPQKVAIRVGRLDENGFFGPRILYATAWPAEKSPGWLVLDAQVPATALTAAEQRRWLDALRSVADRVDPGFGHIEYGRARGQTALEDHLIGRDIPLDRREPRRSAVHNREWLRGYSWLTIASQQVADRLGGAAGLAATGAFAAAEPLASGGVWLLATEDFNDWGAKPAEAVFHAVAPALVPGTPSPRPDTDQPPTFIVFADPSTVRPNG